MINVIYNNIFLFKELCGERGIRTLGTLLRYTRFPGVPVKPLLHLSVIPVKTNWATQIRLSSEFCKNHSRIRLHPFTGRNLRRKIQKNIKTYTHGSVISPLSDLFKSILTSTSSRFCARRIIILVVAASVVIS